MPMKGCHPDQIISKLREAEVLQAQDAPIKEVCKKLGITDLTFYRWREEYGDLKVDQAKRLKGLEKENGRLKRVVADLTLDNAPPEGGGLGKLLSPSRRRQAVQQVYTELGVSERRACEVLGQVRATHRYQPKVTDDKAVLAARTIELSLSYGRYGYPTALAAQRRVLSRRVPNTGTPNPHFSRRA